MNPARNDAGLLFWAFFQIRSKWEKIYLKENKKRITCLNNMNINGNEM